MLERNPSSPDIQRYRYAFLLYLIILSVAVVGQTDPYPHNSETCERCHNSPARFGSSAMTVQRIGSIYAGRFIPSSEGGIHHRNGESAQSSTSANHLIGERLSLSLLGDGYIEAIDSRDIERNIERQRRANLGMSGAVVVAPALEATVSPVKMAGRFGWKSQHSSLISSCADSLRNELGVRNRLYPDEYPTHSPEDGPTPFDAPNPKTGKTDLDRLVDQIRHTVPPPRDESLAATEAVRTGEKLFAEVGCAICHVPTYKTLPPGTLINGGTYKIPKLLGNKVIDPYSDFLLHDVGTGDGIPQAAKPEFLDQSTANKFRTPPLWGLRFRATHLMHDGDTPSPEQAIKRHGGEATKVRDRYELLSPEQKQQLLTFLSSL